jgi:hypothetical protein
MTLKLASISDAMIAKRKDRADSLREIADQVEAGDVTEYVIVGNDITDGNYFGLAGFEDRWRLLGALAHASSVIGRS